MRTSTLFDVKKFIILKFMVCPHGQGGVGPVEHFVDREGGGQFSRVCADVIYGRPLLFFIYCCNLVLQVYLLKF